MSTGDNSLLNFLKTNSLFNQSPTKNGLRKSKSRSKDKSNSINTPTKNREVVNEDQNRRNKLFDSPNEQKYGINPEPYNNNYQNLKQTNSIYVNNPPVSANYEGRFNNNTTLEPFEEKRQNRPFGNFGQPQRPTQLQDWQSGQSGVSSNANFEAARIESFQHLEFLRTKIKNEIVSINNKIETFNSKMYWTITNQFQNLRQRILNIFDEAFKESERYIKEYMKEQEAQLTGDLIKMRQTLAAESAKLESMKAEIQKPQWRKVTGGIIASELDRKIDEMLKQSGQMNPGKWQMGDLVGNRLKDLERDLKGIFKFKKEIKEELKEIRRDSKDTKIQKSP